MRHGKRASLTLGVVALSALSFASTETAQAHGRGRGRPVFRGGIGFSAFGPYFGVSPWLRFGYHPFFDGYWGYTAAHDPRLAVMEMNVARMTGWGAVDLDVKPNRADVWIDGRYVGEARDLDGDPSHLWLEQGPHHIAVYKAGYKTFEDEIKVERGTRTDLKLRLEPGDSLPPGPKANDKSPGPVPPAQEEAKPTTEDNSGETD